MKYYLIEKQGKTEVVKDPGDNKIIHEDDFPESMDIEQIRIHFEKL